MCLSQRPLLLGCRFSNGRDRPNCSRRELWLGGWIVYCGARLAVGPASSPTTEKPASAGLLLSFAFTPDLRARLASHLGRSCSRHASGNRDHDISRDPRARIRDRLLLSGMPAVGDVRPRDAGPKWGATNHGDPSPLPALWPAWRLAAKAAMPARS